MTYQIRIDDQLYESNKHFLDACNLYNTVDETCLQHYIGHIKTLVEINGDKEKILKKDVIREVDPLQIRTEECPIDYDVDPQGWLDYMV